MDSLVIAAASKPYAVQEDYGDKFVSNVHFIELMVLAMVSSDIPLRIVATITLLVRNVSWTSISIFPSFHCRSRVSILLRISFALVTSMDLWRITAWNTMNFSEFHRLLTIPSISDATAETKSRPILPVGTS